MTELHTSLAAQSLRLVPPDDQGRMHDKASTALQFACMAMVAMGVASEAEYGCTLTVPAEGVTDQINENGLWIGDAAVVFLVIGRQLGEVAPQESALSKKSGFLVKPIGGREAVKKALEDQIEKGEIPHYLPDNVKSGWLESQKSHLAAIIRSEEKVDIFSPDGPIRIHPDFVLPFENIGWIKDGEWQTEANEALWRSGFLEPSERALAGLVTSALSKLPNDIQRIMDNFWSPPKMSVIEPRAIAWLKRRETMMAGMPKPARDRIQGPTTLHEMCAVLSDNWQRDMARNLSSMMEARWRPSLGWNSDVALLPLFHDRLIEMVADRMLVS